MPHLIIEYAEGLASENQLSLMLNAVHQAAMETGLFEESHIKTRLLPVTFYRTGSGHGSFIHAQLRIKKGRNTEQKKILSDAVLEAIKTQHWPAQVITVEVVDMDNDSYAKYSSI